MIMSMPRFEIIQQEMGGWVRVYLGRGDPTGEVAKLLSESLTEWFCQNPHLRMRIVVPITEDGDTTELHAWYDQFQFSDFSPMTKSEVEKNGLIKGGSGFSNVN